MSITPALVRRSIEALAKRYLISPAFGIPELNTPLPWVPTVAGGVWVAGSVPKCGSYRQLHSMLSCHYFSLTVHPPDNPIDDLPGIIDIQFAQVRWQLDARVPVPGHGNHMVVVVKQKGF